MHLLSIGKALTGSRRSADLTDPDLPNGVVHEHLRYGYGLRDAKGTHPVKLVLGLEKYGFKASMMG